MKKRTRRVAVIAVIILVAVIVAQTISRRLYVESKPHGWYVTINYSQARGMEQATFVWGTKHANKGSCQQALRDAARHIARGGIVCRELTDDEARAFGQPPAVLLNF